MHTALTVHGRAAEAHGPGTSSASRLVALPASEFMFMGTFPGSTLRSNARDEASDESLSTLSTSSPALEPVSLVRALLMEFVLPSFLPLALRRCSWRA